MDAKMTVRMTPVLEKFFVAFVIVGISAIVAMQWNMNTLIATHADRLTRAEAAITVLEARMVGWDVLKRIELHMTSMSRKDAQGAMARALSSEIAGHEARMKK